MEAIADHVERRKSARIFFGRRDYVDPDMVILNVKALGYEFARALADKNAARKVASPPATLLKSKLCTQADFDSDWFVFWAGEMNAAPIFQRKLWEFCFIAQTLWREGMLNSGRNGLGFGCGEEPLPSLFAKYGVSVLATDQPNAGEWVSGRQHASAADRLRLSAICPEESLLQNIGFRAVDMKALPGDLNGRFDFCWSACALEHLGTLAAGLDFIEASLASLKPGGIAVHTTEFNLSNGMTLDNRNIVLYQRRHVVALAERLKLRGYRVAELDFCRGHGFMDYFVDTPPWTNHPGAQHLKLYIQGFPCTSFGLIVRS
ncbi:MAG: class I SAM-dependent methyltransferase [Alphaproteobacteria bacterium]|nr:class I SAM-dependent methyltransferase [Alphaproteobacteria bacterium]